MELINLPFSGYNVPLAHSGTSGEEPVRCVLRMQPFPNGHLPASTSPPALVGTFQLAPPSTSQTAPSSTWSQEPEHKLVKKKPQQAPKISGLNTSCQDKPHQAPKIVLHWCRLREGQSCIASWALVDKSREELACIGSQSPKLKKVWIQQKQINSP